MSEEEESFDGDAEGHTVHVNDETETIQPDQVPAVRLIEIAEDGDPKEFVLEALNGQGGTMVEDFQHEEIVDLTEEHRTWFRTLGTDRKAVQNSRT